MNELISNLGLFLVGCVLLVLGAATWKGLKFFYYEHQHKKRHNRLLDGEKPYPLLGREAIWECLHRSWHIKMDMELSLYEKAKKRAEKEGVWFTQRYVYTLFDNSDEENKKAGDGTG